jgi:hypothetical protein
MAEVASPKPPIAPWLFADHFNGKFVPLTHGANNNALPTAELLTQFKRRRLEHANTASWTFVRCSPSNQHRRQEQLPPLGCKLAECSPCMPVRVVFGCLASACQRLTSTPGNKHVTDSTTWRWAGWVMARVTQGRATKVQVQLQRHALHSKSSRHV